MRTPALLLPLLLTAALAVAAGCTAATEESDAAAPTEPTPVYLELEVEPRVGEAPLEVDMTARLVGQPSDPESLNCPSLAWDFGNDDVLIAQAGNCKPGWVQREFETRYTYQRAGSYDASVRVLAVDVDPSSPVQVLVRGPTPTLQPLAIVPGPTIIIATTVPRAGTTAPEAPTVTLAPPTVVAIAPAAVTELPEPRASATLVPAATEPPPTSRPIAVETRPTIRVAPSATRPAIWPGPTEVKPTLRATRRPPSVAMATEFAARALSATPTRKARATSTETERPEPTTTDTATPAATGTATDATRETATPKPVTPSSANTSTAVAKTTTPIASAERTLVAKVATSTRAMTAATATETERAATPTRTRSSVTLAPQPTLRAPSARDGAARVLPADLYYVTSADGQLWRLPATGLAPEPLGGLDLPVDAYSVSPAGSIAYVSDGALRVLAPDSSTRTIVGSGASSPLWSPGGRALAFAADGVWLYELASGQQWRLADEGEPMAWANDGSQLLMRDAAGTPIVASLDGGRAIKLPIEPVGEAGWLAGRTVAWMVDPGLRMLATGDSLTLSTILDVTVPTSGGFARPDDKFQLLADRGSGLQRHVVDLADPRLPVVADGPPLQISAGSEFSWAPDGRLGALAGRDGLRLLDPLTGAQAPLVGASSRAPQWVLSVD